MDWKLAARVVAVLAVAVVMVACAIALRPDATEEAPAPTVQPQSGEPASSELLRCREIGAAALDDAGCKKAWAEGRRHFLEGNSGRARP
ncbi:probable TrbK [Nitrobacter winogradskyi Nb-255]|uniref:Probable TrbK n=1 Tax=Nitrobacter winogradskyi (strain ATCC 25391 / DSM 10237 / CIP 104748 / NCIMB 11846 / Nb-255) TaxID=323098 RepID=Q3SQT9_NITWN|nr:putative entry exclusion protein TrbK-alt [Nitrobacter winogradskyi]ABA05352.1 probable TrbK [Nitrobacter winogradskyi Nb-255]